MKIIGHPWIESERFIAVKRREEIGSTPAGSVLLFDDIENSIDLLHYCREQGLPFAVETGELRLMLLARALGACYVLAADESAEEFQAVAQHYLFDMEIIVRIDDESGIESCARRGIDGVVFASSIRSAAKEADAR